MAIFIKEFVLDALRMPPEWQEQTNRIAEEVLGVPIRSTEIVAASVDSRRGTPKILLSLKIDTPSDRFADASEEEIASFSAVPPEIQENHTLSCPLVIGSGPAGIFAALVLALAGAKPIIVDKGPDVKKRCADYQDFLKTRELDPMSNLLIGEGGAGTFSDGKLYTGTRDTRAMWVKKIMAECGAPEEILWQKRAHVGSDKLPAVAENLRKMISDLGGTFLFNTEVTDLAVRNGVCAGVVCAGGEIITAPKTLLAPGLGGRYLVRNIIKHVQWQLKPFQCGCRIEHPQNMIDLAMYHTDRPTALGAAEYHLVSRKHPRHTASFCMCPGGEVVNASAWEGRSISNGMSCFARSGKFANSCLISTFSPEEFSGIEEIDAVFEKIERSCFASGGGDYTLPAQDAAAFIRGESGLKNRDASPKCGVVQGRIDKVIPKKSYEAMIPALLDFDRRVPGFIKRGKLIGAESCVSSPIRILRDRETLMSSLPDLYCAGEGCGLAGGIISAACDGINCAVKMLQASAK